MNDRLWLGTGSGIILSVPLNRGTPDGRPETASIQPIRNRIDNNSKVEVLKVAGNGSKAKGQSPGGLIRVYNDGNTTETGDLTLPFCNMTQVRWRKEDAATIE